MTIIKRRLIIDVAYELDEPDPQEIRQLERNLEFVATHAAGEGLLSDDSLAVVDTWDYRVETPE